MYKTGTEHTYPGRIFQMILLQIMLLNFNQICEMWVNLVSASFLKI